MSKNQEYFEKYVRDGAKVIVPKEQNAFMQMKTDSFRLVNAPGFGDLGGGVDWSYVHEPVNMFPKLALADHTRHITILGGNGTNYLELGGEVEITLGSTREDAQTYKYDEAVSVCVKKGMLYNIKISKVDYPIHYNEFVFGDIIPNAGLLDEAANGGYERYIKSGEMLWAKNQPHHEVVYPVISTFSSMFGASEPIRRTWMPVSVPHVMADKAHYHKYLEYIVFYGSDPDNISDLGGVVEFTVGETPDDLTVITVKKATQFCIKPGLWHSPLVFKEICDPNKPLIFCEVSYSGDFSQDQGNTVWIDGKPPARPE